MLSVPTAPRFVVTTNPDEFAPGGVTIVLPVPSPTIVR